MANILDSKTKREKLPPRREPYWHVFRKGAALGYRKLENGNGTWVARWRDDEKKQRYKALGEFPEYDIAETVAPIPGISNPVGFRRAFMETQEEAVN